MDVDYKSFSPFVRYAYICTRNAATKSYARPLYAYDHRMFYVTEGSICVITQSYGSCRLETGDCMILAPSEGYRITVDGEDGCFAIVSFDFDGAGYGEKSRHPDEKEVFEESKVFSRYTPEAVGKCRIYRGCFELFDIVCEMCRCASCACEGKYDIASALMKAVIIKLFHTNGEPEAANQGKMLVQRVKGYIDREFCEGITNKSIAAHFGYHPYYLGSLFQEAEGVTLHQYIINKRLEKSKALLVNTRMSVSEVSLLCGFSGAGYFTEQFRKRTGLTPREYRSKRQNETY